MDPKSNAEMEELLLQTHVLFQDIDPYLRIQKAILKVLVCSKEFLESECDR